MVLYRVYSQPHLRRYYSTVCSKATLFQIIVYALMIIPPVFIAYVTDEFWHYTSTYREQPDVELLNMSIVQIGDDGSTGIRTWSTFTQLNAALRPEELVVPLVTSSEEDEDNDGKSDTLTFTAHFSSLNHTVQSIQFLLLLQVELTKFSSVVIQSLVQSSLSWPSPASALWVGGELAINQREPLPATGRVNDYRSPLINTSSQVAEDYDMTKILMDYNERDNSKTKYTFLVRSAMFTALLANPYVVWTNGDSGNFTFEVVLNVPTQTIIYDPGFWQLLKFAWIQYLAILVVFWWVLHWVQSFVFENQVILTTQYRTDKPHKL